MKKFLFWLKWLFRKIKDFSGIIAVFVFQMTSFDDDFWATTLQAVEEAAARTDLPEGYQKFEYVFNQLKQGFEGQSLTDGTPITDHIIRFFIELAVSFVKSKV